ncbi:glutamine amidotransferase-like class 1 domain-containing protein 1 [Xenia sp. Carnegie-2017]|uniref:glutamine amidotransferase-like class 1 domain-containing protein 1 n=1 Tax=Xenia sp. Carnegie-2017 TaxID=2897299 RepID=UPI001F03B1E4|nr:glutamine amidotransferase-like class 1 domain-containing protein 1 [Xenia sp. Carnegie-2017]
MDTIQTSKPNCLIVCSSSCEGVSASSFIHAFTLTNSTFNVQIVTPQGRQIEYTRSDDSSKRWINEFRTKTISVPGKLENIQASRYAAILIPSSPGACHDLVDNDELSTLLNRFIEQKKPICAVGYGVAALFSARGEGEKSLWSFKNYSLTAPSLFEVAKTDNFNTLPIIPEDFIRDHGGTYSASECDAVHVIMDRHVITGQNDQSTLCAVQNLILLCNARHGKTKS